jgi:hypothetical protein
VLLLLSPLPYGSAAVAASVKKHRREAVAEGHVEGEEVRQELNAGLAQQRDGERGKRPRKEEGEATVWREGRGKKNKGKGKKGKVKKQLFRNIYVKKVVWYVFSLF